LIWLIPVRPPASLYEQALLLRCDALTMTLMARLGTTEGEMRARHTKLE
jgi:D-arabinose 5-phosphate isomerase GutQ